MRENIWCVVDYEDKFVILRTAIRIGDDIGGEEDYIVPMTDFYASQRAWECFNEFQTGPCPYM